MTSAVIDGGSHKVVSEDTIKRLNVDGEVSVGVSDGEEPGDTEEGDSLGADDGVGVGKGAAGNFDPTASFNSLSEESLSREIQRLVDARVSHITKLMHDHIEANMVNMLQKVAEQESLKKV